MVKGIKHGVPGLKLYCDQLTNSDYDVICNRCSINKQCCTRCETFFSDGDFYVIQFEKNLKIVLAELHNYVEKECITVVDKIEYDEMIIMLGKSPELVRRLYAGKSKDDLLRITIYYDILSLHNELNPSDNSIYRWTKFFYIPTT